jgi:rhomboid protease GluP
VAEERGTTAVITVFDPPLAVLELPDERVAVAVLERGSGGRELLRAQLDRLLEAHQTGVLLVVLAGGGPDDRAVLLAADREAPDPNKLGVYHLDEHGRLGRVAGRRFGLLVTAGGRLLRTPPLDPAQLPDILARTQRQRADAARFAAALDRRPQWVTRTLGAACIAFFALSEYWGREGFSLALLLMGANSGPLVREGELWRLLSHAFLHGGLGHLLVNLLALLSLGGFLEGILGWRRYLLVYGLSALGGGVASALVADTRLSVGASGAIWGLLAAGVGLLYRRPPLLPHLIAARLRPRLVVVLVVNAAFSILPWLMLAANAAFSFLPRIDLFAHAGGGLVGFALIGSGLLARGLPLLDSGADSARPVTEAPPLRLAAAVTAAALAASVALALWRGRPWQLGDALREQRAPAATLHPAPHSGLPDRLGGSRERVLSTDPLAGIWPGLGL